MDEPVRRITPMTILEDIAPAIVQYRTAGCPVIDTGEPGCVGVRVGLTTMILASTEHMKGDFAAETVATLVGRTVSYLYVQSIAEAMRTLAGEVSVVEQVATRGGTVEAVIRHNGRILILAERTVAAAETDGPVHRDRC